MTNTVLAGVLLWLAGLGLSGHLADAGVWENERYGVLFLLSALIAAINAIALFPESQGFPAWRWFAYAADSVVVAAGFYVLARPLDGAMCGLFSESFLCWGFGLANIAVIATTAE